MGAVEIASKPSINKAAREKVSSCSRTVRLRTHEELIDIFSTDMGLRLEWKCVKPLQLYCNRLRVRGARAIDYLHTYLPPRTRGRSTSKSGSQRRKRQLLRHDDTHAQPHRSS